MAIVVSDSFAPEKETRFVGLCINRNRSGVSANFTLRNVVENTGNLYHVKGFFCTWYRICMLIFNSFLILKKLKLIFILRIIKMLLHFHVNVTKISLCD